MKEETLLRVKNIFIKNKNFFDTYLNIHMEKNKTENNKFVAINNSPILNPKKPTPEKDLPKIR